MPTRQIQKQQWQDYFEEASRQLPATNVDVEVDGLDLGAQVEAEHLPLEGFSYDPHDDAISIICEGLEHRVPRPRRISVLENGGGLEAVEIVDADDHTHIARLTRALALPGR